MHTSYYLTSLSNFLMQFVKANVNNLSAASEPGMLSNNENIFPNVKLVRPRWEI